MKNFRVTALAGGEESIHAGLSRHALTSGEITAEIIRASYYTPEFDWNPDPTQYRVEEAGEMWVSTPSVS